jgi:hypothetical protein
MRRLVAAVMACLVVSGVPAAAGPAHSRRTAQGAARAPSCTHAVGRTLSADAAAVVYEVPEAVAIFGCVVGKHRSYFLGPPPFGTPDGAAGVELPTLAGPIVAYGHDKIGESFKEWLVMVRDLRTGRVLRRLPTGTPVNPRPSVTGIGVITSLAVKANGAVAWIVQTTEENGSYQVHAVDGSGARLLASGADVAPASLALAASTLYWTQGGRPFSASLN